MQRTRIDCVGGIVVDRDGRMLLIQRAHEPARGCWSLPGGRVEPGESDAEATAREVREETGLEVVVGRFVGMVERDAPDGSVYEVRDYLCDLTDPDDAAGAVAGDDAADVGWFTADEVRGLHCSPGLLEALDGWGVWTLRRSSAG